MKRTLLLFFVLFISAYSIFSQKDTFSIKIKQEKIIANILILKNDEVIKLTEKAFEITAKSSANKLVSSYSIKLYNRNDKKNIFVHLNSDVTDLTSPTFRVVTLIHKENLFIVSVWKLWFFLMR